MFCPLPLPDENVFPFDDNRGEDGTNPLRGTYRVVSLDRDTVAGIACGMDQRESFAPWQTLQSLHLRRKKSSTASLMHHLLEPLPVEEGFKVEPHDLLQRLSKTSFL